MIISIENISFAYGNSVALKDFSLHIKKGEFVAILGRNGSGKSTLARLLNGLLLPSSGSIRICGMDISDENSIYRIRSRAAMVFQNPDDQIVSAVVEDEVAFGAENIGIEPSEIVKRVNSALNTVGLSGKAKSSTAHLSGGEKQRLSIASALVMEPEILILDEPTSMLDPSGRNAFMETVAKLHQNGMTVVMITHNMDEAAMAQRCIVMEHGEIIFDDIPSQVFLHSKKLAELSLGTPPMCELGEILAAAGVTVPPGILTTSQMADFIERCLGKK